MVLIAVIFQAIQSFPYSISTKWPDWGVFKTLSSIYGGAFYEISQLFLQKSSNIDVWRGPKYASLWFIIMWTVDNSFIVLYEQRIYCWYVRYNKC